MTTKQSDNNPTQHEKRASHVVKAHELTLKEQRPSKVAHGFSAYIRSLMQNWRQGTVKVKGRSDVSFSTAKPWKQKGTGRARAGTRRSPLWRTGGVTFGPQERVRTLKVNRAIKRQVMRALLDKHLLDERIFALDWTLKGMPKTREVSAYLKKVGLEGKKVVVFIRPEDAPVAVAFRNIPRVECAYFDQPNAYMLAKSDYWVVFEKDLNQFNHMVQTWI